MMDGGIDKTCVWSDYDEIAHEDFCAKFGEFKCKGCTSRIEKRKELYD